MRYCPESLPLGGSLDALNKGTVEEEDPQYTYASTLGTLVDGSGVWVTWVTSLTSSPSSVYVTAVAQL